MEVNGHGPLSPEETVKAAPDLFTAIVFGPRQKSQGQASGSV